MRSHTSLGAARARPDGWTPKARERGLLVEALDDETLVYDLEGHTAHCLNPSAAAVWRSADGSTTVSGIARRLGALGLPDDEAVVRLALDRLGRAGLLSDTEESGSQDGNRRVTRRDVMRVLGLSAGLAVLLPVVTSVTAPLAAQAASCIPAAQCDAARPPDCTGLPICENRTQCCVSLGSRKCRAWRC